MRRGINLFYTFRSQKTSTVQQFVIRNKLKESTTIFHLTFSLHEERVASGHNEGARTGGCNMSDDSISAVHIPALVPLQVGSS